MTPELIEWLCDPLDKGPLALKDAVTDTEGRIESGILVSRSGRVYPIRDGIPRFVPNADSQSTVKSFGDEWNYFNFDQFKLNWLNHTVKNTFGSDAVFRGKMIVDCGAGSGMQSRWMSEAGARHVIALELSHSVDDVMRRNLAGLRGVDIVQCSIDSPPLKDGCVDGIVICHNVIQHTRSVEATAHALWRLVAPGGEFAFNCYGKNDLGVLRKARLVLYSAVRAVLSRAPFSVILWYSRVMSILRFVPVLGFVLEKSGLMVRGDVPDGLDLLRRKYLAGVLNTFDCFGSHSFQHLKTDDEIRSLAAELQPDAKKVLNIDRYFQRPCPIAIALRLLR